MGVQRTWRRLRQAKRKQERKLNWNPRCLERWTQRNSSSQQSGAGQEKARRLLRKRFGMLSDHVSLLLERTSTGFYLVPRHQLDQFAHKRGMAQRALA